MHNLISVLSDHTLLKRVLLLAIPMVLSNITVPLLGLVDTAVIGHLEHAWYLGGVALGTTMISVSFWLLGFLRMSTTGLAAQAFGSRSKEQLALVFVQGILMAMSFAVIFLLLHLWIADTIFSFSSASEQVKFYGHEYFVIRAWGAPAALANYVVLGWLLGTQNSKAPMWMVILTNITNILLDILFVVVLGWKVGGAALASVISDYAGFGLGILFVIRTWRHNQLPSLSYLATTLRQKATLGLGRFIGLNRDIFLRSLCLQAAFSFMTFQGASYGDDIVAANAVLMSFLMMISYGMDGFAYAMEAMVGKAVGARDKGELKGVIIATFFWGVILCSGFTLIFTLAGNHLVKLITDIPHVRLVAAEFLPWLIAMPLCAMWCFLFDGIFIGATKGKEMRNSMFFATCTFFAIFYLLGSYQNHALWAAMIAFMLMRGISLALIFISQWRNKAFIPETETA